MTEEEKFTKFLKKYQGGIVFEWQIEMFRKIQEKKKKGDYDLTDLLRENW